MPARRWAARSLVVLPVAGLLVASELGLAGKQIGGRPEWRPHIAVAKRYAKRRAGEVAFAVVDERGRVRGFRMGRTAPAASVFKVMLLVAYLRKRDGRSLSPGDRALLAPMIRSSDSVAATRVRDIVGKTRKP